MITLTYPPQRRKHHPSTTTATAIVDYLRDFWNGTSKKITVAGVLSDGNPYGLPKGLVLSLPVTYLDHQWAFAAVCARLSLV